MLQGTMVTCACFVDLGFRTLIIAFGKITCTPVHVHECDLLTGIIL